MLALETIVISLFLFVPTVYWVHLKVPRLRPVIGFLALIPFVVPPIVMVVGLLKVYKGTPSWFYAQPSGILAAAYVILAFPYMFFSLDAGFRAIDVHTLTEASQSLGASWATTLVRVILPNIRAAALAGSFLALAIVMGEFTIANLAQFHTFPIFLQYVGETEPYQAAAALTLVSFGITWLAMLQPPVRRPQAGADGPDRGGALIMAYLELQGLHRNFGPVKALNGIEIALGEGEFLSLLGPSGCGKTTALRLVAGFDRPDAGRIVVDGKDVTGVAPAKRDMGMVFQAYSLFPNMTAAQNVEFGLKIRGKRRRRTARKRVARPARARRARATRSIATRTSSPAACSSASRSRARSRSSLACSCSTSRSRRSTRRFACSCARRFAAFSSSSGSRRSTSRTTRKRRSRSPTTSRSCTAA